MQRAKADDFSHLFAASQVHKGSSGGSRDVAFSVTGGVPHCNMHHEGGHKDSSVFACHVMM